MLIAFARNASSAPPVRSVHHIHVFAADRAAAERWYREVGGFTRIDEYAFWAADGGTLTIRDRSGSVHLALFERPAEKYRSTIALGVDADAFVAWHRHLARVLGHAPAFEDHGLSVSLYFQDPDGNPYEITTYGHEAARSRIQPGEG